MPLGGGAAQSGIEVPISGDSSGIESALGGAVDKLSDFRTAVGLAGGVLATFAAKQISNAITAAGDFEAAMADVEKVTDPATARELGDAIQDMATRIPMAHDQLADLATQAGRFGAEGADDIREFTEVAASMGAATALSASDAGKALGKMSTALNEPLSEAGKLGDAINELSNNFKTDSEEIVDAAQRSGQVLSEMGASSDQILGLSAAFNETAPTARLAASRMQQVSESMMDPANTEMFADAIGKTGDEFRTLQEENPDQAILEVMDAVDQGRLSFEDLSEQLSTQQARAFRDTAGSADRMREAMETSNRAMEEGGSLANEVAVETDTLAGQKQLLKNRVQNLWIQIGDNLLPYLRDLVSVIVGAVDWFSQINSETDGWAGTITLLVSAIGGAVAAGGALVSMAGGMSAVMGTATAATGALGTAVTALLGPLGLAAAAVAALAYAFKTDFAGIRTATMRVVNTLKEALQPVFAWFSSDGAGHIQTIRDHVVRFVQASEPYIARFASLVADVLVVAIRDGAAAFQRAANIINDVATWIFDNVLGPYLTWLSDLWRQHGEEIMTETRRTFGFIQDFVQAFADAVAPIITHLMEQIRRITDAVLGDVRLFWERHGDQVKAVVDYLTDVIMVIMRTFGDAFATLIKTTLALIRGDWSQAWEYIEGFFARTADRILAFAEKWGDRILAWLGGLVNGVIQWFQDLYDKLVGGSIVPDMLADMLAAFFSWRSDLYSALGDMVRDVVNAFGNLSTDTLDTLTGMLSRLLTAFFTWRSDLYSAISDMVRDVVGAFGDLADDALDAFTDVDFYGAGSSAVSSIASGLRSKISDVTSAAGDVASAVRDKLPGSDADEGPLSDLTDSGPAIPAAVAEGMTDELRTVGQAAREVAEAADPDLQTTVPDHAVAGAGVGPERTVNHGDDVAIEVTIEGDADAREVERGLSNALQAFNVDS